MCFVYLQRRWRNGTGGTPRWRLSARTSSPSGRSGRLVYYYIFPWLLVWSIGLILTSFFEQVERAALVSAAEAAASKSEAGEFILIVIRAIRLTTCFVNSVRASRRCPRQSRLPQRVGDGTVQPTRRARRRQVSSVTKYRQIPKYHPNTTRILTTPPINHSQSRVRHRADGGDCQNTAKPRRGDWITEGRITHVGTRVGIECEETPRRTHRRYSRVRE